MLFADIIIDISVKSLDRPFQYRVPDPLQADAVIGALVDIPFGKEIEQCRDILSGCQIRRSLTFAEPKIL